VKNWLHGVKQQSLTLYSRPQKLKLIFLEKVQQSCARFKVWSILGRQEGVE
jgi:hypothetical protein